METRLHGVLCNHENRQSSITKQNSERLYRLVYEAKEKRDKRAESEKGHLQDLEEKRASGTLSDDEQKIYEAWHNLNNALKEMIAIFCDEFQRGVIRFSAGAERSCYNFLEALDDFDALYSPEQ